MGGAPTFPKHPTWKKIISFRSEKRANPTKKRVGITDDEWFHGGTCTKSLLRFSFFVGGLLCPVEQLNCKNLQIFFSERLCFLIDLGYIMVYPSTNTYTPIVAEQRPPNPKTSYTSLYYWHRTTMVHRSRDMYFQPSSVQNRVVHDGMFVMANYDPYRTDSYNPRVTQQIIKILVTAQLEIVISSYSP